MFVLVMTQHTHTPHSRPLVKVLDGLLKQIHTLYVELGSATNAPFDALGTNLITSRVKSFEQELQRLNFAKVRFGCEVFFLVYQYSQHYHNTLLVDSFVGSKRAHHLHHWPVDHSRHVFYGTSRHNRGNYNACHTLPH